MVAKTTYIVWDFVCLGDLFNEYSVEDFFDLSETIISQVALKVIALLNSRLEFDPTEWTIVGRDKLEDTIWSIKQRCNNVNKQSWLIYWFVTDKIEEKHLPIIDEVTIFCLAVSVEVS